MVFTVTVFFLVFNLFFFLRVKCHLMKLFYVRGSFSFKSNLQIFVAKYLVCVCELWNHWKKSDFSFGFRCTIFFIDWCWFYVFWTQKKIIPMKSLFIILVGWLIFLSISFDSVVYFIFEQAYHSAGKGYVYMCLGKMVRIN